jgi:hypothetical protein
VLCALGQVGPDQRRGKRHVTTQPGGPFLSQLVVGVIPGGTQLGTERGQECRGPVALGNLAEDRQRRWFGRSLDPGLRGWGVIERILSLNQSIEFAPARIVRPREGMVYSAPT